MGQALVIVENECPDRRAEERRANLISQAVITFRGQDYAVPVVNISSRGAMIESAILPRLGENLLVRFENCSRIHGFVRWARDGQLGIRFGHELVLAA